jgi:RNA polymerase sigma-70 factor (ECF subfamily)
MSTAIRYYNVDEAEFVSATKAAESGRVPDVLGEMIPTINRQSTHEQKPVASCDAAGAPLVGQNKHASEHQQDVVDIAAFDEIFTRFQTPICNFIYRLVGNREQAYDLTQDVFVKAYRALVSGTAIQTAALSAWLYRIATNTAMDALRRRRLIAWLPLSLFNDDRGIGAGMVSNTATTNEPIGGNDDNSALNTRFYEVSSYDGARFEQRVADREIVERVLRQLNPKYAICLLLYEHEGFSCAEIAEVLNISPSAVKMRLMRARERFIALYRQEVEDP